MIKMDKKDAEALSKEWGDKPCEHPRWGKVYEVGSHTDYVCLQCGLTVTPDIYEQFKQEKKQK